MSVRTHVLLVVGWGALALLVLFGALALGLALPVEVMVLLVASAAAVPTYLARSPLTPKPVPPSAQGGPAGSESPTVVEPLPADSSPGGAADSTERLL